MSKQHRIELKAHEVPRPSFVGVLKANPYHDKAGRFARADGEHHFVSVGGIFAGSNARDKAKSANDVANRAYPTTKEFRGGKHPEYGLTANILLHQDAVKTLSADQVKSVREYTGVGYTGVNQILRHGAIDGLDASQMEAQYYDSTMKAVEKRVNNITDSLDKMTLGYDALTFRGVEPSSRTGRGILDAWKKGSLPGLSIEDQGFVSTSLSKSTAEGFGAAGMPGKIQGILMKVKTPKETKAMSVELPELSTNSGENEIIFQRETKFTVEKAVRIADGADEGWLHVTVIAQSPKKKPGYFVAPTARQERGRKSAQSIAQKTDSKEDPMTTPSPSWAGLLRRPITTLAAIFKMERVEKVNPYHDKRGRFARRDAPDTHHFVSIGGKFAASNARDKEMHAAQKAKEVKYISTAESYDAMNAINHGIRNLQDLTTTLTPTERSTIKHYTGTGNAAMNQALRPYPRKPGAFISEEDHLADQKSNLEKEALRINRVTAAIEKAPPIGMNVMSFRGVKSQSRGAAALRDAFAAGKLKAGAIVDDPGFVSVSTKQDVAQNFTGYGENGVLMKLKTPANTKGVFVGAYGLSKHAHEAEIILQRNTKFIVEKAYKNPSNGQLVIEALVQTPDPATIQKVKGKAKVMTPKDPYATPKPKKIPAAKLPTDPSALYDLWKQDPQSLQLKKAYYKSKGKAVPKYWPQWAHKSDSYAILLRPLVAPAAPTYAQILKGGRDYVRDDIGRFASTGGGGRSGNRLGRDGRPLPKEPPRERGVPGGALREVR